MNEYESFYRRMLHEFPGLLDDETVINGGDIVQWLSIQVDGMEGAG